MLKRVLVGASLVLVAACGDDDSDEPTTAVAAVPLAADFEFTYHMESPAPTFCRAVNWLYTDTSTGGPTAWLWDFGDGDTSTEQNPQRASSPFNSEVTLTITRGDEKTSVTKNVMELVPVC